MVIALIVTPEGFPLAYEVLAGNTSDKTTLRAFLQKIEGSWRPVNLPIVFVTGHGNIPISVRAMEGVVDYGATITGGQINVDHLQLRLRRTKLLI